MNATLTDMTLDYAEAALACFKAELFGSAETYLKCAETLIETACNLALELNE